MSKKLARSWGRYPQLPQRLLMPDWPDEASAHLVNSRGNRKTTLAYGNGRSYGDSCLAASGRAIGTRGLDRLIEADWQTGRIRAQAGLMLNELIEWALPRGWFPPVTPGTKFVTLGGAVANDVHGKNHHHAGTFGRHVAALDLSRSDGSRKSLTQEATPELFAATVGGLGLTGLVEWVELQLKPVRSSLIETRTYRFASLDEFFELSAEHDAAHEYTVAWVDCLAPEDALGRGLFMTGDHAEDGPLQLARPGKRRIPFDPPFSLVNPTSIKLFNAAIYHRPRHFGRRERTGYEPFFYPLDGILEWNRIYGRQGFQQFQCVIPESEAREAMKEILRLIKADGMGSFLAVLKRYGDIASPGLLSFPMPGLSLALDFPHQPGATTPLLRQLDGVVARAGGRLYPAKDAHMSPELFRESYPAWRTVEAHRDPAILSHFWRRVTS